MNACRSHLHYSEIKPFMTKQVHCFYLVVRYAVLPESAALYLEYVRYRLNFAKKIKLEARDGQIDVGTRILGDSLRVLSWPAIY